MREEGVGGCRGLKFLKLLNLRVSCQGSPPISEHFIPPVKTIKTMWSVNLLGRTD